MQNVGGPSSSSSEQGGDKKKDGEGQGWFDEAGALIDFKGTCVCGLCAQAIT